MPVVNNADDDDEGTWITQENLYSYIAHGDTQVLNLIMDDPLLEEEEQQPKPIMGDDDDDCPALTDLPDDYEGQEEATPTPAVEDKSTAMVKNSQASGQMNDAAPRKVIFMTSDFAM